MEAPTILRIEERLRSLPPEKLAMVAEFATFLADRRDADPRLESVLATEPALKLNWLSPEDDDAWADV